MVLHPGWLDLHWWLHVLPFWYLDAVEGLHHWENLHCPIHEGHILFSVEADVTFDTELPDQLWVCYFQEFFSRFKLIEIELERAQIFELLNTIKGG